MSFFIGFEMYREHLLYKKGDVSDIIKLLVLLLSIFILGTINYFLHYVEYDEERDYVCYSVLGRKFKFKLSEVTFVGYLPFGIDGTYQINYKRYALTKSFPIFCLFSKKKILELYEAAKRKKSKDIVVAKEYNLQDFRIHGDLEVSAAVFGNQEL